MKAYDVIVVGLGAMGSAATYQLAKRGARVLGLDQFSPPHVQGSTHGPARVMRRAIGEGAHFSPLAMRSYELFKEIEAKTSLKLLETTGMLVISNADKSKIVPEGDFLGNTVAAAQAHAIRHEVLDAPQLKARFPQFKVRADEIGYFENDAGYLRPEECVRAQLSLAKDNGADIHMQERVQHVTESSGGMTVKTSCDTYLAENVVLCAGPWLGEMIDPELGDLFKVYRQVQYRFDVSSSFEDFQPGKCPIYFWQLPGFDQWIYGFPALDGPNGGLLVSAPDSPNATTVDTVDREVSAEQTARIFDTYIDPQLSGVGSRCLEQKTCLITATQDSSFVIDRHPRSPRIIVCSPCSGHGFKHSAAIGECIAELVLCGDTRIDIAAFRLPQLVAPV